MMRFVLVAAGGALGAVLRYAVSGWIYRWGSGAFPWGTLGVNLAGSLVIGLLWGFFEIGVVSQNMRLFLFMGILGAFTTFSTFSLESFTLLRENEYGLFLVNIAANVILGIILVFTGYVSAREIITILR